MDIEVRDTLIFEDRLELLNRFGEGSAFNLVLPGDKISEGEGLIQGAGTYAFQNSIYSSLIGYISRTNKLISVKPLKSRYQAKVGDIVIGRVKEIVNKKWKVDVHSHEDATLHLNSIKLPEIQRRKTEEDERQMRSFLTEGDLLVAEVQAISNIDKSINLHIRNDNFGKLKGGALLKISSNLVKKGNRHMVDLSMGIKLFLGMNGMIWMQMIDLEDEDGFEKIAKLRNIITIYDSHYVAVRINDILDCYNIVKAHSANELLSGPVYEKIVEHLLNTVNQVSKEKIGDIMAMEEEI